MFFLYEHIMCSTTKMAIRGCLINYNASMSESFFLRMTDKTIALTKDDDDDDGDIYQINALREFALSGHST